MAWYSEIDALYSAELSRGSAPTEVDEVLHVPYSRLAEALEARNPEPFLELVVPLVRGAVVLIKQAFNVDEISKLKSLALEMRGSSDPSFHKVKEGVPNFWRDIGEDQMGSYALQHIKKSVYFFPWNDDSAEAFELAYPRWRVLKVLAGLSPNEYESFTPKDGKVDRLQIVEYPAGTGFLAPHQDPDHNQRLIMSAYLSKRGVDYFGGGFWALATGGEKLEVESQIDAGDLGTCLASIVHGVDATDNSPEADFVQVPYGEAESGSRWFVGFYTNDSDELANRKTVRQVDLT